MIHVSYLIVYSDPGPVDSLLVVVLVCGGLQAGGEEDLKALLLALAVIGVPLAKEEEIVRLLLGEAVTLRG